MVFIDICYESRTYQADHSAALIRGYIGNIPFKSETDCDKKISKIYSKIKSEGSGKILLARATLHQIF